MKAKQLKMRDGRNLQALILVLGCLMVALWVNPAAGKAPNPIMVRIAPYRMESVAKEIALARSAAPASISDHAEILVLGRRGYDIAVKGTNGFVCLVERSWARKFSDAGFWSPRFRAPLCLNQAALRSVESTYLKRTEWVLAGMSRAEMHKHTLAAVAAKKITAPEPGAMSYMMSKEQNFAIVGKSDIGRNWYPHLMFYYPAAQLPKWGANLRGGPVISINTSPLYTIFLVLVPKWSDGTPSPASK